MPIWNTIKIPEWSDRTRRNQASSNLTTLSRFAAVLVRIWIPTNISTSCSHSEYSTNVPQQLKCILIHSKNSSNCKNIIHPNAHYCNSCTNVAVLNHITNPVTYLQSMLCVNNRYNTWKIIFKWNRNVLKAANNLTTCKLPVQLLK